MVHQVRGAPGVRVAHRAALASAAVEPWISRPRA
jgi:hypothetical protein